MLPPLCYLLTHSNLPSPYPLPESGEQKPSWMIWGGVPAAAAAAAGERTMAVEVLGAVVLTVCFRS